MSRDSGASPRGESRPPGDARPGDGVRGGRAPGEGRSPSFERASRWLAPALIFVLALLGRAWLLGDAPLAGTEGHRALTAHEMVETGRWITPHLYGRVYLIKPPLHYWTLAALEAATGTASEWVWRFPSALGSALFAAFLCIMAGRWFGGAAGLVSGGAYLALIPLWAEARSADIDGLNNAASVACGLCLIELLHGRGRRWAWSLAAGVLFGAALLFKGHAGAPVVAGAVLGLPLLALLARAAGRRGAREPAALRGAFRSLATPWLFAALGLGLALAALWVVSLAFDLRTSGESVDVAGLREARSFMTIERLGELARALLLPPTLVLFALPVSLSLPLGLFPSVRGALTAEERRIHLAVLGAFAVSLILLVLAGVTNPRYGYVSLPLVAVSAGVVGETWRRGALSPTLRRVLRWVLGLGIALFALLPAAVHLSLLPGARGGALPYAVGLALALGALAVFDHARDRPARSAWLLLVLVTLSNVAFAYARNENRRERSSYEAGREIAEVLGDDRRVVGGLLLFRRPELFHYAEADAEWRLEDRYIPVDLAREGWVILDPAEWKEWSEKRPERLSRISRYPIWKAEATLAWYRPPAADGSD